MSVQTVEYLTKPYRRSAPAPPSLASVSTLVAFPTKNEDISQRLYLTTRMWTVARSIFDKDLWRA